MKVFLSERLSQDPLENFFGCQRQRRGTGDDPTVVEFVKNTNALKVIDTVCGKVSGVVSRGNCRGNKESIDEKKENTPLCKRRCYISQIDIHSLIHTIMYNYTVMFQYNQKCIAYTYNYFDYCIQY